MDTTTDKTPRPMAEMMRGGYSSGWVIIFERAFKAACGGDIGLRLTSRDGAKGEARNRPRRSMDTKN